ncbi:MAG: ROK family protein, partial [Planctomycetes bacterium]|nr:ROK family protein [Planctomycetota bacterium]
MSNIYAGVDLGGTMLKCALAGEDGEILAERSVPTESHEGPDHVLKRIAELVKDLAKSKDVKPAALGMGV